MLLSLTCSGPQATDLGYLLHKNPSRAQAFPLPFGQALVFYPEAAGDRCTACLLLDIDPLDLAKGREDADGGGLFQYVNDRPFVASSFMSAAMARVFGTAMAGRCAKRPELPGTALDLEARLTMLPCRGDTAWLERVFAPLGYQTSFAPVPLDESFEEWGASLYGDLAIRGRVRLCDLLNHLYVLIPVFDRQKHYWMAEDEVDKLLRHGQGWLEGHPERDFIAGRYLSPSRDLARMAKDRLDGDPGREVAEEDWGDEAPSLRETRLAAMVEALKASGARSVLDLGCGGGTLLRRLLKERCFTRIAGADVSPAALERAARRLRPDRLPEGAKDRLQLFQASLAYADDRFAEYEALALVEVLEHLDPWRLDAMAQAIFREARPATVVLSTPNREYNQAFGRPRPSGLRHADHRFEFTRQEFRDWAGKVAGDHGYRVDCQEIGVPAEGLGAPSLMGVFQRCG